MTSVKYWARPSNKKYNEPDISISKDVLCVISVYPYESCILPYEVLLSEDDVSPSPSVVRYVRGGDDTTM